MKPVMTVEGRGGHTFTDYNADGSIDGWAKYEYDANGKVIKTIYYNADGSIEWQRPE